MAAFLTYSYHAMVIFFSCIFIWVLFSLDDHAKRISCAIVLVPLLLRALLIR
jgi:hypothetical protein